MNYVGFGPRFVAYLIDAVILGIAGYVVGLVLGGVMGEVGGAISGLFSIALQIAYLVFYQAKAGQTIGKKAMNIKVVDASGKTPTVMTFFLREVVGKFISSIILGIGFLMILWDGKKQGLHDKIAKTYVVKA